MTELSTEAPTIVVQGEGGAPTEPEWKTFIPKEGKYAAGMKFYLNSAIDQDNYEGVDVDGLLLLKEKVDWDKFDALPLRDDASLLNMYREARNLLNKMWSAKESTNFPPFSSAEEANNAVQRIQSLLSPYLKIE